MTLADKLNMLAIAGTFAAASATSASAYDTMSANVTGFSPSPLVVVSNGQDYTKLDVLGMTNMSAHLEYDVGAAGRVHSWKVTPIIENGYGIASQVQGLADFAASKSYGVGDRPKVVSKNVVMSIPAFKLNSAAVSMCNWKANSLREQGKSNAQIFGADQEVSFKMDVVLSVDASGSGSNNPIYEASPPKNVKVVCQKWQGAQVPTVGGLKAPIEIKKATMKLQEVATMGGTCMVKLTTAISTSEAGATLKYRFVHSSGKKSKTFTTKTAGNKIAVVNHQWEIPNKAGPETGWMQMEGVSPSFHSNKPSYSMNCRKAGAGGFVANPQKPKVRVPLGSNRLKSN